MIIALFATLATIILSPTGAPLQPYQTLVDKAHVRTPSGIIHLLVREEGCDEISSTCVYPRRRLIVMESGFDFYTPMEFLHEIGHIESYEHRRFVKRIYLRVFGGSYDEEKFAMGYSWCALNLHWPSRRLIGYGYAPTLKQHRQLCRELRRTQE